RRIREELNIFYSRLNELGATARTAATDIGTKEEIARREQELVEFLREGGSGKSGWATLQRLKIPTMDEVQTIPPRDEVLVEYYTIGDRFQAFIISRENFDVVRDLTTVRAVRSSLKGLTFQLSKFHLQPVYVQMHGPQLLQAAQHHLLELYQQL